MTSKIEFMIPSMDSESFNIAVYRFTEMRTANAADWCVKIQSEPFGPVHRKTLTLESQSEMSAFIDFWSNFRRRVQGASLNGRLKEATHYG